MICTKCGTQLDDNVKFCHNCGAPTGRQEEPVQQTVESDEQNVKPVNENSTMTSGSKKESKKAKKKHTKAIIIAVCVIVACIIVAVGGFFAYKAYQNKPENKFERTVQKFEKQLEAENYSEAEKFIDLDRDVYGKFGDFAEKCLKGAKLKVTKGGYTLTSDQGTYTLTSSKDGEKIVPTDMYMDIKVKCSTYLNYKPFSGCSTSEVLDDGMTLYTVKIYKAHQFEIESCVALGNESDMALQTAKVEATTDDDYKVNKITAAYRFDDESNTYDGAYLDSDGTIVMDMYFISEAFAEKVARTHSALGTDMSNAVLSGKTYEDFYAGYDSYMFDTDCIREEYESMVDIRSRLLNHMDSTDFTATKWTYPQQFRYSNGQYVLNVTEKNTIYKNNKEKGSSTGSIYVLFKPGRDRFKVFSYSENESDIYKASEASENKDLSDIDTEDMEEWQLGYIDYLNENQSDIGHASLGYLNDDDIPELFIINEKDPSHSCTVQIYSYIDGKVKKITADSIGYSEFGSYGYVAYYDNTGIIVSSDSGMGASECIYIKMNDDGTTEVLLRLHATDIDRPEEAKYYVDDTEVTEEKYNNASKQVIPADVEISGAPDEDSTVSDVINQISQMQ